MKNDGNFIIFGAGEFGRLLANRLIEFGDIVCFLDNNNLKQGLLGDDIPIKAPGDIVYLNYDLIFVPRYYSEIKIQLLQLGVDENKIVGPVST
jgi:hypothetical protein